MARKSSTSALSPATASTRSGATTTLPSMPSGDVVVNAGPSTHADATPVAVQGDAVSFGTVIHASAPAVRYSSVKEPPSGSAPPHVNVAVVSPISFTSRPVGTPAGCTRTDASLLATGAEPSAVYVTWQRT